jgi:hypothetical protein
MSERTPFLTVLVITVVAIIVQPFALNATQSKATHGAVVLWGTAGVAVVTSLFLWGLLGYKKALKVGWNELMAPAKWDFSESWATNLTLVGALLATVLADSALIPSPTVYLEKETYGTLNALFAFTTVLAPLLYVCLGKAGSQGSHAGFVAASLLTLWAVLGQLFTLGVLLCEINGSGKFPPGGEWLIYGLFGGSVWLVLTYYWDSVSAILEDKPDESAGSPRGSFWSPL